LKQKIEKQNKRKKTTCLCLSENGTGNRVGCKNDNKKSALSFLIDSSCAIPHFKKQDTYTDSRFRQKKNEYKTDDNYGSKKQIKNTPMFFFI
jgi:hypothetical protein